jgi:hypothetical protein
MNSFFSFDGRCSCPQIVHFGLYMDYKVYEEYVTTYSQFKELNGQTVVLTTFEIKILE